MRAVAERRWSRGLAPPPRGRARGEGAAARLRAPLPAASAAADRRWGEPGGGRPAPGRRRPASRGAPVEGNGRRGFPRAAARYRDFELPLCRTPRALIHHHHPPPRAYRPRTSGTGVPGLSPPRNGSACTEGRCRLGGAGGALPHRTTSPSSAAGAARVGGIPGAGGAPPFPGPPPPPRRPGGFQPCRSVSEAGGGGDGVPYTPPGG